MKDLRQNLQQKFLRLYKNGERLLAIQLNGFSHTIFYDYGNAENEISIERVSAYLSTHEKDQSFTDRATALLLGLAHYEYQNNAKEIVYVAPSER